MKNRKKSYWVYLVIVGVFILLLELWLAIDGRVRNKNNSSAEESELVVPK
jgi:hypothetical protein